MKNAAPPVASVSCSISLVHPRGTMSGGGDFAPVLGGRPNDVYFVGLAQPHTEISAWPTYRGTLLRPHERRQAADWLSTIGAKPTAAVPLVLDHANVTQTGGRKFDPSKQIGHVTDGFVDAGNNLWVVGQLAGDRWESETLLGMAKNKRPIKWGLSLFTDFAYDAAKKSVEQIEVGHVGVTTEPAWAEQKTWIYEITDNPAAIGRVLRDRYFAEPGAYVPRTSQMRYASEPATKYAPDLAPPNLRRERGPAAAPSFASSSHGRMAETTAPTTAAIPPSTPAASPAAPVAPASSETPVPSPAPSTAAATLSDILGRYSKTKDIKNPAVRHKELRNLIDAIEGITNRKELHWTELAQFNPIVEDFTQIDRTLQSAPPAYFSKLESESLMNKSDLEKLVRTMKTGLDAPPPNEDTRLVMNYVAATAQFDAVNQKKWEQANEDIERARAEKRKFTTLEIEYASAKQDWEKKLKEKEAHNLELQAMLAKVGAATPSAIPLEGGAAAGLQQQAVAAGTTTASEAVLRNERLQQQMGLMGTQGPEYIQRLRSRGAVNAASIVPLNYHGFNLGKATDDVVRAAFD